MEPAAESVLISLANGHPTLSIVAMVLVVVAPAIMPLVTKLQLNASKKELTNEAKALDDATKELIKKDTEIRQLKRNQELTAMREEFKNKIDHVHQELRGSWKTIEHEAMKKLHALEVMHSKESEIAKENKQALDRHLTAHEVTNEKFFKILDEISKTVQSMSNRMTEVETTIKMQVRQNHTSGGHCQ
jgi:hypothetical protein